MAPLLSAKRGASCPSLSNVATPPARNYIVCTLSSVSEEFCFHSTERNLCQALLGLRRCIHPKAYQLQAKWTALRCDPCAAQARLERHNHPDEKHTFDRFDLTLWSLCFCKWLSVSKCQFQSRMEKSRIKIIEDLSRKSSQFSETVQQLSLVQTSNFRYLSNLKAFLQPRISFQVTFVHFDFLAIVFFEDLLCSQAKWTCWKGEHHDPKKCGALADILQQIACFWRLLLWLLHLFAAKWLVCLDFLINKCGDPFSIVVTSQRICDELLCLCYRSSLGQDRNLLSDWVWVGPFLRSWPSWPSWVSWPPWVMSCD